MKETIGIKDLVYTFYMDKPILSRNMTNFFKKNKDRNYIYLYLLSSMVLMIVRVYNNENFSKIYNKIIVGQINYVKLKKVTV